MLIVRRPEGTKERVDETNRHDRMYTRDGLRKQVVLIVLNLVKNYAQKIK